MSILGYVYFPDIAGTDTQAGMTSNPKIITEPPVSPIMASNVTGANSNSGITENWYKKLAFDDDGTTVGFPYETSTSYVAGIYEYPTNSTELWVRFLDIHRSSSTPPSTWMANNRKFIDFYNVSSGVKKLVASLVSDSTSSNMLFRVYAADGVTVAKQHTVSPATLFIASPVTGEVVVDFRFYFDKTTGFIQQYDYTTSRVAEVLGQTVGDLPVTHIVLYSTCIIPTPQTWSRNCFRIVANEPTFGMFVMPFYAKSEGSDQNQLSGSYSRFSMGRYSFTSSVGVTLEKPSNGDPARYSYVPKNLTEQGLPANYNVLSIQVNAVVDGSSATPDPVSFTTYLKEKSTGTRYELSQLAIKSNVEFSVTKSPQIRTARWDKNPVTGQSWQPADLSNFEIGFKI